MILGKTLGALALAVALVFMLAGRTSVEIPKTDKSMRPAIGDGTSFAVDPSWALLPSRGATVAFVPPGGEARTRCAVVVAVQGDRVVGFIMASQKHWGFGLVTSGWIELVGVHPNHMGSGVGKALGEAILDHFEEQEIGDVYTAVKWDYADLITFFKSIGFGRSEFINLRITRKE